MALVLADRVRETSTSTGTGTITLAGAFPGFQSFTVGVGTGNTTYYTIANLAQGEWEVGLGTYTASGTTLSRTTVFSSSNGGSLVNFAAGTKDVFVTQPAGRAVYLDSGTNATLPGLTVTGTTALQNALTYGGVTLSNAVTGTGNMVLATSPTLVTPNLGTPSTLVGTNITGTASGLTAGNVTTNANLTGAITSVGNATSLGSFTSANLAGALTDETGTGANVFGTSPTLVTPILGTPQSVTLTNGTGLPISTGVSGLATGVATFLATPSSANLAAAVTNETGSGALVFATSPTLVTPALGTPSSGTLTNATGLPIVAGTTGTLTVARGGTNATTAADAVVSLGVRTGATGSEIIPTGTTAQRNGTPQAGFFRFNTTNVQFEGYTGTAWSGVGGASGGGGNPIVYENDSVVTASYTITTGKNASSTGPLTINSGITVTVPTGSRWVVL
jgi:hypothetical protein